MTSFTEVNPIDAAPPGASRVAQFLRNLSSYRRRIWLYSICATGLYIISMFAMAYKARYSDRDARFDFACSDGKSYYVYLPALLIDHTTFFGRILEERWGYPITPEPQDPYLRAHNKYPIGVALSVLPSFLLAHVLSVPLHAITGLHCFAPDGYSVLYQALNLAYVLGMSVATLAMLDWLMVTHFGIDGLSAGIAALFIYLGTQYLYHLLRFPLMSNVFAPFWATCCVILPVIAIDRLKASGKVGWHWPAMVFCFWMAVACRNTNGVFGVFLAYALYALAQERKLDRLLPLSPLIVLAFAPIVLQSAMWHYQTGHYFTNSYGAGEPFYWTHPAFWQEMFSLRAGVLVYCPVWTLGTIGAIYYLFKPSPMKWVLGCYFAVFMILWYVNSAWWCWPFTNYPGRAFVELLGMPMIGLGLLLHHVRSDISKRRLLIGFAAFAMVVTWGLFLAYDLKKIPRYGDEVVKMGGVGAWAAR